MRDAFGAGRGDTDEPTGTCGKERADRNIKTGTCEEKDEDVMTGSAGRDVLTESC